MPVHTLLIAESVLATVRTYSRSDRQEVARLFRLIQADPAIDNRVKLVLVRPPAVYTVYASPRFWIVYHVVGNVVSILKVGRAGVSEPTPW